MIVPQTSTPLCPILGSLRFFSTSLRWSGQQINTTGLTVPPSSRRMVWKILLDNSDMCACLITDTVFVWQVLFATFNLAVCWAKWQIFACFQHTQTFLHDKERRKNVLFYTTETILTLHNITFTAKFISQAGVSIIRLFTYDEAYSSYLQYKDTI